jgi:hypothetical protein
MLAFAEEAIIKNVKKLRKVLAFTEGTVKKVLESLEMCWQSQKRLLKKFWQV